MISWEPILLEKLLAELALLGSVSLRKMNNGGWHADCEFPSPEGVTAQVRSDFKHKTPIEALQCVHDRLGGLRNMVNVAAPVPGINHMTVVK
jgi:hypothetical protein